MLIPDLPLPFTPFRAEPLNSHRTLRFNVHGKIYGNAGPEPRGVQYIGNIQCHRLPQRSLLVRTRDGGHQRALRELGTPFGYVDPSWGSTVRL